MFLRNVGLTPNYRVLQPRLPYILFNSIGLLSTESVVNLEVHVYARFTHGAEV
jgi:hypothetical protein